MKRSSVEDVLRAAGCLSPIIETEGEKWQLLKAKSRDVFGPQYYVLAFASRATLVVPSSTCEKPRTSSLILEGVCDEGLCRVRLPKENSNGFVDDDGCS